MHPTGAASLPATAEAEVQAMQSMDWLFKKERIYLLAQFWQQRATLAEKEVTNLKEQLATTPSQQAKVPTPNGNLDLSPKDLHDIHQGSEPLDIRNCPSADDLERLIESQPEKMELAPPARNGNGNTANLTSNNNSGSTLEVELAAKDKEITKLVEDVKKLQTSLKALQDAHEQQLMRFEERLDEKRQHIARLEARLELQRDYEDSKRDVSSIRSVDLTSPHSDGKPYQPSPIDRKSIEALKSPPAPARERDRDSSERERTIERKETGVPPPPPPRVPSAQGQMQGLGHGQRQQSPQGPPPPPPPLFPTQLHTVETFGSFLGEEIVASWRRGLGDQRPPSAPAPTPPSPAPQPLNNNTTHLNNNPPAFREESLKSPYEHRGFRFADDMGPLPPGALVGRLGDSLIPKGDPMEARLQEMLRYNMDKYASQSLDTLHISRRVRELLSVHNIGQRLFAKYVLGLSQGTVSELLSKPKPWDKLTEKGRDSYRKMHAWACDEAAIMLLKSLIPKKAGSKEGGMPPFGRPDGSDGNDDRLAHILNEASHHMKNPGLMNNEDSRSNEDSSSPRDQCTSPFSKDSSQNRRLKKYDNDDIPQEKVVRIYQEELAKLMGRRMDDMRQPREGFPGFFFPHFLSGGIPPHHMERGHDDNVRMALDSYHRELAKLQGGGHHNLPNMPSMPNMPGFPSLLALQQQAIHQAQQAQAQSQRPPSNNPHMNGSGTCVQDLSLPKEKMCKMNGITENDIKEKPLDAEEAIRHAGSAFSLVRPKIEPGTQASTGSSASSPLGNTILPPAITPNDDFSSSAAASPLQRMASITNSLISQPTNPTHHTSSQRPMKAVLPPITQQQFDLFNNLNTEDIVKRVKESLSQYSISQRLFGESVLGLSQGSVSDLLARPKPWHMLTQKGREPFIRMKMFLEDDNAVHKLVASQYKIAPEKLMRTGSYGGIMPQCPPNMNKPMPPTPKMISEATQLLSKMQEQQSLMPPSMHLGPPPQGPPSQTPMLLTPPGYPPHHAITIPQNHSSEMKPNKPPQMAHPLQHSPLNHQQSSVMRALHQHISPSVYEMAALTQDLDTQTITTKIKEALLANNIGQKIFGEAVLGLSQGSVSELLSKPKPWHMLSIKGREPFIRMQLWLSDAHNVDRLQALKNERREANKRRRSTGAGAQDNSSDTSSNDTSEFYHSNSPGPNPNGPPSAKKQRVLFSEEQKEALRLAFALDPYPNMATIEFLATELGLSTRTITNWFHNHRMRLKQQVPHGMANELPVRDQSGNQPPFDHVQFRLLLNQRLLELQKERMGLAGVPLPYPPYFAANPNLAALISRGLLPTGEMDLNALNNAVKEQMSGLDLSMPALKRDPDCDDYDDDDVDSNMGSDDSLDDRSFIDGDGKMEPKSSSTPAQMGHGGRSNRRKPAAPQWVNPDWQDDKDKPVNPDEVIINGVCVMQTEDYGRRSAEETVRIEPTPVMDRFADDDVTSIHSDAANDGRSKGRCSVSPPIKREDGDEHIIKDSLAGKCDSGQIDDEDISAHNEEVDDLGKSNLKVKSEDDHWEY